MTKRELQKQDCEREVVISAHAERQRQHFLHCITADLLPAEDGYYYWYPPKEAGILGAHHLRWIADELDRRNKEWDEVINRELSKDTLP